MLSISRAWSTIRENYKIMISGLLGDDYKQYALSNASIFDNVWIRSTVFEFILIIAIVLILAFIFAFKSGFWSGEENDNKSDRVNGRIQGFIDSLKD